MRELITKCSEYAQNYISRVRYYCHEICILYIPLSGPCGPWYFVARSVDLLLWAFILLWDPADHGSLKFDLSWDPDDPGSWGSWILNFSFIMGSWGSWILIFVLAVRSWRFWILCFCFVVRSWRSWILTKWFSHRIMQILDLGTLVSHQAVSQNCFVSNSFVGYAFVDMPKTIHWHHFFFQLRTYYWEGASNR